MSEKLKLNTVMCVKKGMTRIFDDSGLSIPVTVLKIIPNVVSQVKDEAKDGYNAYQIAYDETNESRLTSPIVKKFKKINAKNVFAKFFEVKTEATVDQENLSKEIDIESFQSGDTISVTGVTKGKGFAGVMKRYNFQGGPAAHGSKFHRRTGSIGNRATPGRVFPQKKMPGHMGNVKQTIKNLKIVEVNATEGYLLIKGSVPGAKNSFLKLSK